MSSSYGFYKKTSKNLGSTYKVVASPWKSLEGSEIDDTPFMVLVKRSEYQCISGTKKSIVCTLINAISTGILYYTTRSKEAHTPSLQLKLLLSIVTKLFL